MAAKTEWASMTWREVDQARKEGRVVLIPAGTCETQGRHTAVGFEHVLPYRLALEVASRTSAIVMPVLPYGWSADFADFPGTVSIRPETLGALYEDVFRSVISQGFDHLLVLATHNPNQQMIEEAAYVLRIDFGIRIAWINPGQLANRMLEQVSPSFKTAKGHGADPGISLGEFMVPGSTDFSDMSPNETIETFMGFEMTGMAASFEGFPIGLPTMLQDVAPVSNGSGDPTIGTAEQGQRIFSLLVEYLTRLVDQFRVADTHVAGWQAPGSGRGADPAGRRRAGAA